MFTMRNYIIMNNELYDDEKCIEEMSLHIFLQRKIATLRLFLWLAIKNE